MAAGALGAPLGQAGSGALNQSLGHTVWQHLLAGDSALPLPGGHPAKTRTSGTHWKPLRCLQQRAADPSARENCSAVTRPRMAHSVGGSWARDCCAGQPDRGDVSCVPPLRRSRPGRAICACGRRMCCFQEGCGACGGRAEASERRCRSVFSDLGSGCTAVAAS